MPSNRKVRVNGNKIAPMVVKLTEAGWTRKDIAEKLGCSVQTVWRIRERYKAGTGDVLMVVPAAKDQSKLPPEVVECLDYSIEGFERFYNRYNTEYGLPPHARRFAEMAIGRKQVIVNVPPGHMKSSVFSIWMPIWLIASNRDIQILLVSKTQALAIEFCRSIAWEMESNVKMVKELGRFKPTEESGSWSPATGKLSVEGRNRSQSHGGTLLALGAGQQVFGFRADQIIADDLIDTEAVRTEDRRKQLSEWFNVILRSRLRPGPNSRLWIVGTRFHPEDIYGELIAKKVSPDADSLPMYQHINFPALSEPGSDPPLPTNDFDVGEALWPDVWPPPALYNDVYLAIGSSEWMQTYQQVPAGDGEALARPEWIFGLDSDATADRRGCLDLKRNIGQGVPSGTEAVRVISVDPSAAKYCGIICADVVKKENGDYEYIVIDIVNEKMLQREMMAAIERMCDEYGPVRYLIFEVNAFARWFVQDVSFTDWTRERSIRVIAHTTGRNKTDGDLGLESLSREFEFGRIRLPYADVFAKTASQSLIREATQYTKMYKGRTDVLMALWFIQFNRRQLRGPSKVRSLVNGWSVPRRLSRGFAVNA